MEVFDFPLLNETTKSEQNNLYSFVYLLPDGMDKEVTIRKRITVARNKKPNFVLSSTIVPGLHEGSFSVNRPGREPDICLAHLGVDTVGRNIVRNRMGIAVRTQNIIRPTFA
ncbi:unnamed protein product [Ilex paraguariensis]|uniref:Uncharacterized protein n=1 Tax=Ilex paraguariensis TaxID=185542 RepID=A0ABC8QWE4_9AQUA